MGTLQGILFKLIAGVHWLTVDLSQCARMLAERNSASCILFLLMYSSSLYKALKHINFDLCVP